MTTTTEAGTETEQRAFAFLRLNERPPKPRKRGVTEIRGPYYTPVGRLTSRTCSRRWAPTSTRSSTPAARSR